MSKTKNTPLDWYSSMKKKNWERFRWFLTQKIDFGNRILALFKSSPLHQFSKFNNFLWICCFLGKNLSNFIPSAWKLNNPYYHNLDWSNIMYLLQASYHPTRRLVQSSSSKTSFKFVKSSLRQTVLLFEVISFSFISSTSGSSSASSAKMNGKWLLQLFGRSVRTVPNESYHFWAVLLHKWLL